MREMVSTYKCNTHTVPVDMLGGDIAFVTGEAIASAKPGIFSHRSMGFSIGSRYIDFNTGNQSGAATSCWLSNVQPRPTKRMTRNVRLDILLTLPRKEATVNVSDLDRWKSGAAGNCQPRALHCTARDRGRSPCSGGAADEEKEVHSTRR